MSRSVRHGAVLGALVAMGALAATGAGAPVPTSQGAPLQPAPAREALAPGISTTRLSVGATASTWTFLDPGAARAAEVWAIDDAGAAALTAPGPVVASLQTAGPAPVAGGILGSWPGGGAVAHFGRDLAVSPLPLDGWWQPGDGGRPIALAGRSSLLLPGQVAPAGSRVAALGDAPRLGRTLRRTIGAMGARAPQDVLRLAVVRPSTRERRALTPGKMVRLRLSSGTGQPVRWALGGGSGDGQSVRAALAGNAQGALAWVVAEEGMLERTALIAALKVRGLDRVYGWAAGGASVGERAITPQAGVALIARHQGVRIERTPHRLTPGGDGVDERGPIRVVAPSPGTLRITLTGPGGERTLREETIGGPTRTGLGLDPAQLGLAAGRYTLRASVDGGSGRSEAVRTVVIDPTLRRFSLARTSQGMRAATALLITLARPATLRALVRTPGGRWVAIGGPRRSGAGQVRLEWDGRIGTRDAAAGDYTVRVEARSDLGVAMLERRLTLADASVRAGGKAQSALPER